MDVREKLVELIVEAMPPCYSDVFATQIADHLIANGVTIPVRCKDCKHYAQFLQDNKECRCTIFSGCYDRPYPTEPDDFCSYGERRSDV